MTSRSLLLSVLLFFGLSSFEVVLSQENEADSLASLDVAGFAFEGPDFVLSSVPFTLVVKAIDSSGAVVTGFNQKINIEGLDFDDVATDSAALNFLSGIAHHENAMMISAGNQQIELHQGSISATWKVRVIPGILSLLPPIFAILLAFMARQVLLSLFLGIWLGAIFISDYNIISGFMRTIDTYLVNALADPGQAAILIFSMTLGGMVGVLSRSGGMQGVVDRLAGLAKSARGGQLATWAMGLVIFFDDYANTLVVGNTMRPFTDRLRISREKLSYIVDSTAAPVTSIAIISTWVGFQVGLIDQVFTQLGIEENAYNAFLQSIPHSTYSILTLIFVFIVAVTLRDFGPMHKAEIRASSQGKILRDDAQPITDSAALDMVADDDTPKRWYNGVIPIGVVILLTFIGLYVDGKQSLGAEAAKSTLGQIFGAANSSNILMWASFSGLFVAGILALTQRILTLGQTIEAAISGYKSMMLAAMILILAWSIGDICEALKTADYMIALTRGILSPHLVPVITFLLASFISFSTGSSWATMAILTPIVVPIAHQLPAEAGLGSALGFEILIGSIGAILSGSVLGDHCSPISDTTILSSMASAADHVDHVRTQMPYAICVGVVACLVGYLPNGWGLNPFVSLSLGVVLLVGVFRFFGKKSVAE